MKKTLVIQNLGFIEFLFALAMQLFGYQVFYMDIQFSEKKDFWFLFFSKLNIHRMGCHVVSIPSSRTIILKKAEILSDLFFKRLSKSKFDMWIKAKIEGNSYDDEYRTVLKSYLQTWAYKTEELIVYTQFYHERNGASVIVMCDNHMISRYALGMAGIYNIEPRLYTIFKIVMFVFAIFVRRITQGLLSKFKKYFTKKGVSSNLVAHKPAKTNFDVVYFPHKGIRYGEMFIKDQFYSDDNDSKFFPGNILHLGMKESNSKFTENYYKENNITYADYYSYAGINLAEKIKLLFWIINTYVRNSAWKYFDVMFLMLYYHILISVFSHKARLKSIGAKLILIGYDYLFPVLLSYSARIEGVVTASTQERFLLSWRNPHYIFDFYFTIGKDSGVLINNKNVVVNQIFPVGSVRRDKISSDDGLIVSNRYNLMENKYELVCLVLDYHTENSIYADHGRIDHNSIFNKNFYEMIISVAKKYNKIFFAIKSKNCDFIKMDYFSDVVRQVSNINNVDFITDYNKWSPYLLASISDFSIALHTSLADEMLQVSKPVIIYDPPNLMHPSSVTSSYDDIVVDSHELLCQRIDEVTAGDVVRYKDIASKLYPLAGVSVKNKINSALENKLKDLDEGEESNDS